MTSEEVGSLRRNTAFGHVVTEREAQQLIETCEALYKREWEIRCLLHDLPGEFAKVRERLNRLAKLVAD
jgi:hypothetical protein